MEKIAHCIHHTHWDLIWYFTVQDASAQFSYNTKEMLKGFREGTIKDFFMDGQTAPIDEYIQLHPEDKEYIAKLVRDGKLIIGPFQSQLDCFISSGESVMNNLRLGIKSAKKLGKSSNIAYLPDSFGHSYDFPKIFKQFGIHDFVITRGVGDNYGLDSEFYMKSNDGSELLVCTMIAGYGYGCYAFKDGTLFDDTALDYNKISVASLMDRLLTYSTLENEFVFPLGFDQNPAMLHIPEKIEAYNKQQKDIKFHMTTWEDFTQHVRKNGKNLKVYEHELFSTQYHRLHKSIFSARADIKALQDQCERVLTYELQPIMSMLDSVGIPYDHGLIDKAWYTLLLCQTHSSANLTDETNNYIERETRNALQLAISTKVFLMKLVSISLGEETDNTYPLIVFHTLPIKERKIIELKILTTSPTFKIMDHDTSLSFSVVHSEKKNCGVLRKDITKIDDSKFYYETDILLETSGLQGISYCAYDIVNTESGQMKVVSENRRFIENDNYQIYQNDKGIVVYDKQAKRTIEQAIYLEESGDEGDSFDYSYPDDDAYFTDYFDQATVSYQSSDEMSWMKIDGAMYIPENLAKRKYKQCNQEMPYSITIKLKKGSDTIEIEGSIHNKSEQHRVRLIVKGAQSNSHSYAGTQYGYIKRETNPKELQTWKKGGWFEEPSPTFPLLNHVSMVNHEYVTSVFTKSSKEYEFVHEGTSDIAITLFRSYGAMGYPDLNRRPGRPSGLDYMVFETPTCQMKKENTFMLAIRYTDEFKANEITNTYIQYACETSCYQKQNFDKSLHPIAYFPTNPWHETLPRSYEFLTLDGNEGSFSTIVKSDISNSFILRTYNNTTESTKSGTCVGSLGSYDIAISDMEEIKHNKIFSSMPELLAGELRITKFTKV